MERYELDRFNRENREILRHSMKASRAKAIMPSAMEWLASLGIAGVLLVRRQRRHGRGPHRR